MTATWRPIERTTTKSGALSFGQQSLWFLDRWSPGQATYNIPWAVELRGTVDPRLVRHCLTVLIERHEPLRTVFSSALGEPHQVLLSDIPFELSEKDTTLAEDPRHATRQIIEASAREPFDLERGPLVRATLVRRADQLFSLVVVFHHIVWDEWSTGVFEREFTELYSAAVQWRDPKLSPVRLRYLDFVAWQRDRLRGDLKQRELGYWRDRLAGVPEVLTLPTDRPRPPVQSNAGTTATFEIPAGVVRGIRELATQENATTYIVGLAAFAVVLSRYSGNDDMVIGSPVAGRDRMELENLVGYFVNMLALRVHTGGEPTFRELVHRVRDDVLEDFGHQDIPFEMVVDQVVTTRPGNHPPLVQVVFGAHHGGAEHELRLGDVTGRRVPVTTDTAKFDLIWSVTERGTSAYAEVEYSTALFDAATIDRLTANWLAVLDRVAAEPDVPFTQLPLLPAAELAVVGPRTPVWTEPEVGLHERFEQVALTHSDRIAVAQGGLRLSYAELNARANRLARRLLARGVGAGDRVGLLLDRTPAQIEAILAVLKVGATYVPVDPANPAERIDLIFDDANPTLILRDEDFASAEGSEPGEDNLGRPARADDVAYIIYTSGSTGRPKGVEVTHRNVLALFEGTAEHFGFGTDDVWTMFHSYSFDFSVWEMWGALLHGGRVVVVPFETSRTPGDFARLLAEEQVTMLSQTPSALAQLSAALRKDRLPLPRLRWVVLGGEALEPHHVTRWFAGADAPRARLCNMYGITETTVHVTSHDIVSATSFDRSVIGRPLPHLSVAVVDQRGRLSPIGASGEMFVGGAGVAKGYTGRPDLTAERFVANPCGDDGTRWYRTGDLARWHRDGTLEYLGRIDDQVKIRGFRIELGEITQTLSGHHAVTDSFVAVREDGHGDRYLAAYAVADAHQVRPAELRNFLTGALPGYMVPRTIMVLDRLPLTSNGKVDHRALPEPMVEQAEPGSQTPPRTAVERLLADVWQEVLEVGPIGRDANFFELGGDSIRSVQVAGLLKEHGYELDLGVLFTVPVLADLAPRIQPVAPEHARPRTEPFALVSDSDRKRMADDIVDAYPMTELQLGMIFHMELAPERRPYQNINSYRMSGTVDEKAFSDAVAEVIARHPVLRTTFELAKFNEPMQLVHRDCAAQLVFEDLRGASEFEQHKAITARTEAEWATAFTLDRAPLLRLSVQHLSEHAYQLTLVEHHAILDGWSFTSLLGEILRRHADLRADPASPPQAPPTSQFSDFVALELAAKSSVESQRFWQERLAGISGALLPGVVAPGPQAAESRVLERELPESLGKRMREFAGVAGVSMKSVALAAHVVALGRVANTDEVVTGLTVNGRIEDATGVDARGIFLNTVPIRVVVGAGSWLALVKQLHEQETEITPHRRFPYARLCRYMSKPTLDCSFTFNRFHALGKLSDSGVEIVDTTIGVEPTIRREPSHFPLSVAFVQDPGSDRSILFVDHATAALSSAEALRYSADFMAAAQLLVTSPQSDCHLPRA